MNLNIEELCSVVQGRFLHKVEGASFNGVSIDSRESDLTGKVFFAVKGSQFDGHDFLQQVVEKEIGALVVHKSFSKELSVPVSVIKVDDTLKALHRLCSYWRKKIHSTVIGITGSSGKTTTKKFCSTLLKNSFSVIASPKSFNNIYGVPLTILSADKDTDILIQEMGMNQKGEIKRLCKLAQPDIVIVTEVGDSHIGKLGGREHIAEAKEEIYIHSPKATAVFNGDNIYTKMMYEGRKTGECSSKKLVFSSQNEKADVFLQIKKVEKSRLWVSGHLQSVKNDISVPVTGAAHLNNLMAASTLALAAGLKEDLIWERLSLCQLPRGRNQWVKLSSGAQALFDAYNASPESVMALLDHFLSSYVEGDKILILGDFLELGDYLETFQKKVAKKIVENKVSLIWFIGDQSDSFALALKEAGYSAGLYFSRYFEPTLAKKILSMLNPSITLAFKASRKVQLEKVLAYFKPLDFENLFSV